MWLLDPNYVRRVAVIPLEYFSSRWEAQCVKTRNKLEAKQKRRPSRYISLHSAVTKSSHVFLTATFVVS